MSLKARLVAVERERITAENNNRLAQLMVGRKNTGIVYDSTQAVADHTNPSLRNEAGISESAMKKINNQ